MSLENPGREEAIILEKMLRKRLDIIEERDTRIKELEEALDWIDIECTRSDIDTNGKHIIGRIKVKATEALGAEKKEEK